GRAAARRGGDARARDGGGPPRPRAPAPPGAGPSAAEPRRLVLLQVALISPRAEPHSSEMTRALEGVMDKVRGFGGWVDSVGLSSVVGVFGLDSPEDAPRLAVNAAVAIRRASMRARRDDPLRPDVSSAVSIASLALTRADGEVAIESDGLGEARAYLHGLLDRAEPGSVIVAASAAATLGRHFELAPLGVSPDPAYRLVSYA